MATDDSFDVGHLLRDLEEYLDEKTRERLITYLKDIGPKKREQLTKPKNQVELQNILQQRRLIQKYQVNPLLDLIKEDVDLRSYAKILRDYQERADQYLSERDCLSESANSIDLSDSQQSDLELSGHNFLVEVNRRGSFDPNRNKLARDEQSRLQRLDIGGISNNSKRNSYGESERNLRAENNPQKPNSRDETRRESPSLEPSRLDGTKKEENISGQSGIRIPINVGLYAPNPNQYSNGETTEKENKPEDQYSKLPFEAPLKSNNNNETSPVNLWTGSIPPFDPSADPPAKNSANSTPTIERQDKSLATTYTQLLDVEGKEMWQKAWGDSKPMQVSWKKFIRVFKQNYPLPSSIKNPQPFEECMKMLLASTLGKKELVSVSRFESFLNHFGPLLKFKQPHIVSKMASVAKESYFFGNITESQAAIILENAEPGTFLVRIGHKYPGSFVVNFVHDRKKEKQVSRILINYKDGFTCRQIGDFVYDRIQPIINALKEKFPAKIKQVAIGSPFAALSQNLKEE